MNASAAPAVPSPSAARRAPRRRWLRKLGFWLSVVVIVSPAALVFLWMLSLSLKTEIENIAYPPVFIPSPPTFANFVSVFEQNAIGRYFWNSVVVSGGATLAAVLTVFPLDADADPAAITMQVIGDPDAVPEAVADFAAVFTGMDHADSEIGSLERHAFYQRARGAAAIVLTGELRPYGNVLLVKGFVNSYSGPR